jgi:hypothetical protein
MIGPNVDGEIFEVARVCGGNYATDSYFDYPVLGKCDANKADGTRVCRMIYFMLLQSQHQVKSHEDRKEDHEDRKEDHEDRKEDHEEARKLLIKSRQALSEECMQASSIGASVTYLFG